MNTGRLHGVTLIAIAAVLWGTTGTGQSFASSALSSLWIGTSRLAIAAAFFAVWWAISGLVRGTGAPPVASGALPWRAILGAALAMSVYNLAFFAGVRASSVAVGTAIALGSAPVWAGLLQTVLTRRAPVALWWLGVGVAVTGLALASASGRGGSAQTMCAGIGLCLLAGLSYAFYARCTKAFAAHSAIVALTGTVFGLAALIAAPLAFAIAGAPVIAPADLAVILWLGVVSTGVAYLLFALGLRHVSSATAVALGMAEPAAAVGFAVVIVGERPGALAFAGLAGVLIGLGVLVCGEAMTEQHRVRLSRARRRRTATAHRPRSIRSMRPPRPD